MGIKDWRREKIKLRLVGPDVVVLFDGEHKCKDSQVILEVEAGKAGVYRLHTMDNVWIESSLERSVVWTGVPGMHIMDDREPISVGDTGKKRRREFYEKRGQLVFQATVPRRWWFWVPPGVTEFSCRAMRADRCMSQREDWGYFIITPRGQRIKALWFKVRKPLNKLFPLASLGGMRCCVVHAFAPSLRFGRTKALERMPFGHRSASFYLTTRESQCW